MNVRFVLRKITNIANLFMSLTLSLSGKYKYLGLNFSTMLSYNIGTEDFVSWSKKGTI